MQRITAPSLALLFCSAISASAYAGSQSLDCTSRDKTISLAAGNSSEPTHIKFIDKDGKPATFEGNAKLMPEFDYSSGEDGKTIMAIPVSKKSNVKEKHQTMRIRKKTGELICYGRQAWDDTYTQTFLLSTKDGSPLKYTEALRDAKKVPYLTDDGYILAALNCHSYGVTTAGGCRVENDDDLVDWVDDKDIPGEGK